MDLGRVPPRLPQPTCWSVTKEGNERGVRPAKGDDPNAPGSAAHTGPSVHRHEEDEQQPVRPASTVKQSEVAGRFLDALEQLKIARRVLEAS